MKMKISAAVGVSLVLLTTGARAGQEPMQSGHATAPAADAAFMKNAAADGLAEVELGRLAGDKATREDVKEFAKMMVDDHSKANEELKGLASRKNVTLPDALKPQHKATRDRLSRLSGAAFDAAYLKAMVGDHQKAVAAFGKEAASGKDADTKGWASQTLPKLKEHLEHVKGLAAGKAAAAHQ